LISPNAQWFLWAPLLVAQNFAFTFVSRARNSASLMRHAVAAVCSNGIWFINQLLIFSVLYEAITGKLGWKMTVFAAVYYTVFTMSGSLYAHWWSLKTEKGKARVGAYLNPKNATA
jgi:hypothetical protein